VTCDVLVNGSGASACFTKYDADYD